MKAFLRSRDGASKGAALMIVLALVVLLIGLALAYFSRAATDRQLAQSSYNDTSADLMARSALDIVVNDFKQEILSHPTVTPAPPFYITPVPYTPTPLVSGSPIPNLIRQSFSGDPTGRTSSVNSGNASANGRSISTTRWNTHYLIPRGNPSDTSINPSPTPTFMPPDWVLVTAQGPAQAPPPTEVIGRYAFAVYDEGGLLDMSLSGAPIDHPNDPNNRSWPSLSGCTAPSPTPWLVNVGRKGIVAFADLTALPASPTTFLPQSQVDNIVGWRNYAMTQRTGANFGSFNSTYAGAGVSDCAKQNWYGSYLLYFGDPPFLIDSLSDKLLASTYPFTSVANYAYPTPGPGAIPRTDQALTTRKQLLQLRNSLGFSQNVLQYMGTFSRERNRPAPDWPNLQNNLSEGRFNLSNLALLVPNPAECVIPHGRKRGWQNGKNKNHLCGSTTEIISLFGLFWIRAETLCNCLNPTEQGHWRYIGKVAPPPNENGNPNAHHGIECFRGPNQQNDFFQILNFALTQSNCAPDATLAKVFGIGASLIDQFDSGEACTGTNSANWDVGCDMDAHISQQNRQGRTHTTVIEYGHQGNNNTSFAYGLEPNFSDDPTNGDVPCSAGGQNPHRPSPAPNPIGGNGANKTVFVNHAFSNVGELGYGIDSSALPTPGPSPSPSCAPAPGTTPQPTLNFSSPNFPDAPVLDFFSYNPVSSAYPRAGIVNLYTKNAPVIAAMLAGTLKNDVGASPTPNPLPVISGTPAPAAPSEAMQLANAIVAETQGVLAGAPPSGWPVTQTDMTRAIAARLAARASNVVWGVSTSDEIKKSIARSLAEMGQTRTWNLFIDVIAQTGRYAPDATNITQANKFIVEGEKRYWLHIALGRDLNSDGSVDVLGTQLEEVIE
jgi:hypothetical protein